MKKRFWNWVCDRLCDIVNRLSEFETWVYYKTVYVPPPIPPGRTDYLLGSSFWGKVEWPTRSVAHETFAHGPLKWGEPPMWLCTCAMATAGTGLALTVSPGCPVHDPAKQIGGFTIYSGIEPMPRPSEGDNPCPPSK